jgi:hypothetical protein
MSAVSISVVSHAGPIVAMIFVFTNGRSVIRLPRKSIVVPP